MENLRLDTGQDKDGSEWTLVELEERSSHDAVDECVSINSDSEWSMLDPPPHNSTPAPLPSSYIEEHVHPSELYDIERAMAASLGLPCERSARRFPTSHGFDPPHYAYRGVATITTRKEKDVYTYNRFGRTVSPSKSEPVTDRSSTPTTTRGCSANSKTIHTSPVTSELDKISGSKPLLTETLDSHLQRRIMDLLHFPDAFALTVTCRLFRGLVNLSRKKQDYVQELRKCITAEVVCYSSNRFPPPPPKMFCDVCLYRLEPRYFKFISCVVCKDCEDMRARALREQTMDKKEAQLVKGHGCVAPVWRPSVKMWPSWSDTGIWYRDRE